MLLVIATASEPLAQTTHHIFLQGLILFQGSCRINSSSKNEQTHSFGAMVSAAQDEVA